MKTKASANGKASDASAGAKAGTLDPAELLKRIMAQTSTSSEGEEKQFRKAIEELCGPALEGETTSASVISQIDNLILACANTLSDQLSEIVAHDDFRELQGAWLDLYRLVTNVPLGENMRLDLWNVSRDDILADLDESQGDMHRTRIYDVICRDPGALGGIPVSLAVLGWKFDPGPESMRVMNHVAEVLEAASVPGVGAADPSFFGTSDFTSLMRQPEDLADLFQDDRYAEWRTYRESSKSRFIGLTVPSYLARLPYGEKTGRAPGAEFFEERADGKDTSRFVWGSLAFVYAELVGIALAETGWPSRSTGWIGGGRVDDMNLYTFSNATGETETRPPTQTVIDTELEPALSRLGFIPGQWKAGSPSLVFEAAASSHKPKQTTNDAANASEQILSLLPLLCSTCRVGAHLRVMAKDLIGANWDAGQIKAHLTSWVNKIVVGNDASPEVKAEHPLKSAEILVVPSNKPGGYAVTAKLEHWVPASTISVALSITSPAPMPAGK